jgi:hypothetical protein
MKKGKKGDRLLLEKRGQATFSGKGFSLPRCRLRIEIAACAIFFLFLGKS